MLSPLERIRQANSDDDELHAVVAAMGEGVSRHQIAGVLGITVGGFPGYLVNRAVEVPIPARLDRGDLVVFTQRAPTTLMQVTRPYRRAAGDAVYSAEVVIPGNRHQRVTGGVVEPWFPVKEIRTAEPTPIVTAS